MQVNVAEPTNIPPLPEADAVMVMGPPDVTQVAMPVFASTVATVESEEAQCAGKLVCVVGA